MSVSLPLCCIGHSALRVDGLPLIVNISFISVCRDPPYKVEESGYAGFILPIEVYFKNKVNLMLLLTNIMLFK